jgi:hypothetical protein
MDRASFVQPVMPVMPVYLFEVNGQLFNVSEAGYNVLDKWLT